MQVNDSILPVASLLLEISGNRDVHNSIVTMVRNMKPTKSTDGSTRSISQDWAVERQATKLIRHKDSRQVQRFLGTRIRKTH